jgi:cobalamin biosynthesis protein CobD/CbiB
MTREQFDRIVLSVLYAFVLGMAGALVYRMWR